MVQYCSVSGCSSRSRRDLVAFFRFPTVRKRFGPDLQEMIRLRREKWVNCIPRFKNATEDKFKHARVCANHFISGKPAALQDVEDPDWVPSLNLRLEPRRVRLKRLATEAKAAPSSGYLHTGVCGGFGSDPEYSDDDEYNSLPPPEFLNVNLDIPDDDDCNGGESDCDIPSGRLLEPEVKIEVLDEQDTAFDYQRPEVEMEIVKHEPEFDCYGPKVKIEEVDEHETTFDCHGPEMKIEIVEHELTFNCNGPEGKVKVESDAQFEGPPTESPTVGENNHRKRKIKSDFNERKRNERVSVISQNDSRTHKFGCPLCKTTFELQDDLRKHVENHQTSTCGICSIDFQTRVQLQEHWVQWHSLNFIGRLNEYPCGFCGKTFGDAASLSEHSIAHAGPREFKCSSCDAEFSKAEELLRHRNIHMEEGYRCQECNKAFFSRGRLDSHIQNAHRNAGCRFVCDRCGKEFGSKVTLKRHLMQHKDERDLYRCCKCTKSFTDKDSLKSHRLSAHPTGSKFICNHCNMNFPNASRLAQHVMYHSEQGPFGCSKCPKTFFVQGRLNQHMGQHSGSRPYPCHLCRRSFIRQSHLKQHARAHTIRAAAAKRTHEEVLPSID